MSSYEQKAAKPNGQENTDAFISECGRCSWRWLHNVGLTLLSLGLYLGYFPGSGQHIIKKMAIELFF